MKILLFHIFYFACINLLILLLGYVLVKRKMVFAGWILMIAVILAVYFIFLHDHPIIRMLSIIATTFSAMKVIAVAESYKHKPLTLTFKQWFTFAGGWAGMRAEPFEKLGGAPVPGGCPIVKMGISRILAGFILIFIGHKLLLLNLDKELTYILVSGCLLIGLSLILHFGMLSISAGMWHFSGVNTYLLFRQPYKATSLTEFWSKRWNIAFSEMTSVAIFRPLKNKIGPATALMLAFMFSGLLHELALSVPVNAGYGLPMIYFIIQGCIVLFEKFLISRKIRFLQNRVIAAIWVFFWLALPMPLLFHPEFIKQIVWPLAGLTHRF
jgi:hypothetical protein